MPSERHITASEVRTLCGSVSDMTLWRWLQDPNTAFPKPTYVRKRRYWREAEVDNWWHARQEQQVAA